MMVMEYGGEEFQGAPISPSIPWQDFALGIFSCLYLLDWWFYAAWCSLWRNEIRQVEEHQPRWFCIERRGDELWPVWRAL